MSNSQSLRPNQALWHLFPRNAFWLSFSPIRILFRAKADPEAATAWQKQAWISTLEKMMRWSWLRSNKKTAQLITTLGLDVWLPSGALRALIDRSCNLLKDHSQINQRKANSSDLLTKSALFHGLNITKYPKLKQQRKSFLVHHHNKNSNRRCSFFLDLIEVVSLGANLPVWIVSKGKKNKYQFLRIQCVNSV